MKLALRKTAATDATLLDKIGTWLIKARLVTRFPHAGIVVDDWLYHVTARGGLHITQYTPERWTLIDVGGDDGAVVRLFNAKAGARYDWFSLLAFVGLRARDRRRYYCYEWCWECMTGEHPKGRVTPETLLALAAQSKGAAYAD